MPSNREAYFEALKMNVPKAVIDFALQEVNGFDYLELTQKYDEEILDYYLFINAIKRYVNGEMIEYIFRKTYFLSNKFYINKNVLIPRQETEQLVNLTLERIHRMFGDKQIDIADVCTGSGVIGITIASVLSNNNIYLTDISEDALEVAKVNANKYAKNINILKGDMLSPLIDNNIKLDVLVCNPPYIEDIKTIDERTWKQEPHLALLASPSTFFYEQIFEDYQKVMKPKFLLAFEIGEDMEDTLTTLIKKYFDKCEYQFVKDIYEKTRFLFIKQE